MIFCRPLVGESGIESPSDIAVKMVAFSDLSIFLHDPDELVVLSLFL